LTATILTVIILIMTRHFAFREVEQPIHPGEVLQEEFLAPMNISQYRRLEQEVKALAPTP
jgi:hypothetical protein